MRTLAAIFKLFLFAVWSIAIVPLQIGVLAITKERRSYVLPCIWHKGVCRIFRISLSVEGSPAHDRHTVFICNHLSYLDIPVLGSVLKASFIAKSEVSTWPVFGFLSRLQQTLFIERKRSQVNSAGKNVSDRILKRQNLILFAEGTSTDGQKVRPFKSSLFGFFLSQQHADLCFQPLTICLSAIDKRKPETQSDRDVYAWHIEMDTTLPAHLWRFAKTGGAHIHLIFHDLIKLQEGMDRKQLAKLCHKQVARGLEKAADH